jgi:hypothetical protein
MWEFAGETPSAIGAFAAPADRVRTRMAREANGSVKTSDACCPRTGTENTKACRLTASMALNNTGSSLCNSPRHDERAGVATPAPCSPNLS